MSPEDMEFEITEPDKTTFNSYLNLISSHTNMSSVPGKKFKDRCKRKENLINGLVLSELVRQ